MEGYLTAATYSASNAVQSRYVLVVRLYLEGDEGRVTWWPLPPSPRRKPDGEDPFFQKGHRGIMKEGVGREGGGGASYRSKHRSYTYKTK